MNTLKYLSFASFMAILARMILKESDLPMAIGLAVNALTFLAITAVGVWEKTLEAKIKPVDFGPLEQRIKEARDMAQKALIEVERQRDEQAKVHSIAEETQKLLSQVNLGMGFRPFKKREQA